MSFFTKDNRSAIEAIEYAQWIAFAPMVFQATRILKSTGILFFVNSKGIEGTSIEEIVENVSLPHYGVRVLLESGLGIGLLTRNNDQYAITKTGFFILSDKMTEANMGFTHDVCYQALFYLEDSIKNERPEGLKIFGDWETVYGGLSQLPENVQKSWFAFDHFYSDDAFPIALPLVFKNKIQKILDIGGNTGKWALQCASFDPKVQIVIVDLKGQLNMAKQKIEQTGFGNRISFIEGNILDDTQELPKGFDAIWMSQFLDCFSEKEIISILGRCYNALEEGGSLFILEPFWDLQNFKAGAFSLQQTSLYFTAIANGNSQMYDSQVFLKCIDAANFSVEEQINQIGVCQTLIKCKKKDK